MKTMGKVLGVAESGFYAWRKREPSQRQGENERLTEQIAQAFLHGRGVYGSPRVHAELRAQGISCGKHRVARLMRQTGLRGVSRRKSVHATPRDPAVRPAPDLVDRKFAAGGPNQLWVADITYIPTREGWLYLAAVEDLYSRRVVGWSMAEHLESRLVVDALALAVERRLPGEGLLAHSDRGSQYASDHYQRLLAQHGITCSMSRRADCWDNAPMESFFASLKKELVHGADFATRAEARAAVVEYIEVFYNTKRRHSSLGYVAPAEYERKKA